MAGKTFRRKAVDRYLELVVGCPLVSIKTQAQFDVAQAAMDRLLAKESLDEGESLYLDALSDLVATYEDAHSPIAPASDADMLRHLMDAMGITQAELHRRSGIARSTLSEVLAGKKPFSKAMIRALAEQFQVSPGVLASNL